MKLAVLILIMALALIARTAAPRARGRAEKIRNVLFIIGDDHAAYALGAYGNRFVRTPHLDRLAARGMRFDRAYANSPVCTPSRQSMLTGKLPHAAGVTLLSTPLAESQLTLAEHLKQSGFRTGAIGKMHFVDESRRHGFDERIDTAEYRRHLAATPPRRPPADVKVKPPWRPFRDPARIWLNAEGLPVGVYDAESEGEYFARQAIEFMQAHRDDRFCLWLGFHEPHSPFDFPIEYARRYDPARVALPRVGPEDDRWIPEIFRDLTDDEKRGITAAYYTSVEYLDTKVGLVLDALRQLGLEESTLVIYLGDNGYLLGHHGRFEKHTMWEPAVRVPLMISHPGLRARGRATEALVELRDLAPTITGLLGLPPLPGAQGESLIPLLEGQTTRHRAFAFSEYLEDNAAMVRSAEWKFVYSSGRHDLALGYATGRGPSGRDERLYHLSADPEEFHNVVGDPRSAEIVRGLKEKMLGVFLATDPRAGQLPPRLSPDEQLDWFLEPPEKAGKN